MIKFENTEVMNFEGAIRGMRNPMNSWDKSDSGFCETNGPGRCEDCVYVKDCGGDYVDICTRYIIGPRDHELMMKLRNAGTDHRKFMRQILVSVDITAPLYWWKEFDTYKVGTVANSCSTMHKIHEKPFELDDFSHEHLCDNSMRVLQLVIDTLNLERRNFMVTKDKWAWWQMIQLLPSSYNQRRTVTLNYEVLRNIAESRKNHKLDEWRVGFMGWIKSLPYAEDLIIDGGEEK